MKTKTTFLNFYKLVLEKMKFDHQLFWKEYQKAIQLLNEEERNDLNHWVTIHFSNKTVALK